MRVTGRSILKSKSNAEIRHLVGKIKEHLRRIEGLLKENCEHNWQPDFMGEYNCEYCGKNSEVRPEEYNEENAWYNRGPRRTREVAQETKS
jgi:hypothetical protein